MIGFMTYAQDTWKISTVNVEGKVGILPVKLSLLDEVDRDWNYSTYARLDTQAWVFTMSATISFDMPVYIPNDNMELGLNFGVGGGWNEGLIASVGLTGYIIELPINTYLKLGDIEERQYWKFMLGYKSQFFPLSYYLPMLSAEYMFNFQNYIRVSGSFLPYKYYSYYTNGYYHPSIVYREFSVTYGVIIF
jgi:hypothetical protein